MMLPRKYAQILAFVLSGFASVATAMDQFPTMEVSENSARILTPTGQTACTIPRGTKVQPRKRDEKSEKILVDVKHAGCPTSGIVDADSIDFQDADSDADSQASVAKQGTRLRSAPNLKTSSFKCALSIGTDVEIVSGEQFGRELPFYKVRLKKAISGCPKEGFIASNLLENTDPYAPLDVFNPKDPNRRRAEAEAGCTQCSKGKGNLEDSSHQIRAAVRRGSYQAQVARALTAAANRGSGHVGKNLCYRAVKRIVAAARVNGKRIGNPAKLVGGSAMDALRDLPKAGFKNGYPATCHDAGAILVYEGPAHGLLSEYNRAHGRAKAAVMQKVRRLVLQKYGARATAGDLHGHIEMLGTDGQYHHFIDSNHPMSQSKLGANGRRKLVGCFTAQE